MEYSVECSWEMVSRKVQTLEVLLCIRFRAGPKSSNLGRVHCCKRLTKSEDCSLGRTWGEQTGACKLELAGAELASSLLVSDSGLILDSLWEHCILNSCYCHSTCRDDTPVLNHPNILRLWLSCLYTGLVDICMHSMEGRWIFEDRSGAWHCFKILTQARTHTHISLLAPRY